MAKIWLLESEEPSAEEPIAEKDLNFCFTVLGLRQRNFIGTSKTNPLSKVSCAVVEITEADQDRTDPGWEIGFYRLRADVAEVRKALMLSAMTP